MPRKFPKIGFKVVFTRMKTSREHPAWISYTAFSVISFFLNTTSTEKQIFLLILLLINLPKK